MVNRMAAARLFGPSSDEEATFMPASSQGIRIATVAAGPCAVHCMAIDMDGRLYSWGRNEVRMHGGNKGHGWLCGSGPM